MNRVSPISLAKFDIVLNDSIPFDFCKYKWDEVHTPSHLYYAIS